MNKNKIIFPFFIATLLLLLPAPALALKRVPQNAPTTPLQPLPMGTAPNYQGSVNFQSQGASSAATSPGNLSQPPASSGQPASFEVSQGQPAEAARPSAEKSGVTWLVLIVLLGGGVLVYFYVSRNNPKG